MNKRITITVLVCLVGLWSAAAPTKGKNDPPPPVVETTPKVPTPPPKLPPPPAPAPEPAVPPISVPPVPEPVPGEPPPQPVILPLPEPQTPPPAASPVIAPPQLPTRRGVPAELLDGNLAERLHELEEGGLQLEPGPTGVGTVMGPGPAPDDPLGGAGIQQPGGTPADPLDEFCKHSSHPICRGRGSPGGLPPDGDPSGFYRDHTTPDPHGTDPGGPFSFGGPTAGGGLPSPDSRASDDTEGHEGRADRGEPTHDWWTDKDGRRHDSSIGIVGGVVYANNEVHNRDGSLNHSELIVDAPDPHPGGRTGDRVVFTTFHDSTGRVVGHLVQHCRGSRCTSGQPGESGYGQGKARPWFCGRNPKAKGCEPVTPGSQTDPATPDGEGTPTGRRPATHRLGGETVVNPDEFHDNSGGGGSGPLDMKDPACQGSDCPGGPR